jgi:hypothetical protein
LDRSLRRNGCARDDGIASWRFEDLADRDGRGAADKEMTAVDEKIERAANRLQQLANRVAAEGGFAAKLAQPLADDAQFLRKLKPSLIKARARGEAPTAQAPARATVAPPAPQLGGRPAPQKREKAKSGGPNPWLVVGAAFAAGVVVAKVIDWRSHAHPRH